MDKIQREVLRSNHVSIVNELEPKGQVLDTLYEDGILTDNDLELIVSKPTRKERCQILLSILPTRGPSSYGAFKKALEIGCFGYLANLLVYCDGTNINISEVGQAYLKEQKTSSNVCIECEPFYNRIKQTIHHVDSEFSRMLQTYCCLLLDNVEPKHVVDTLYQDHVITTDQIEMILRGATRRRRCEALVDELMKNTQPNVIPTLKLALKKKYTYINDMISDGSSSSTNDTTATLDSFKNQDSDISNKVLIRPNFQFSIVQESGCGASSQPTTVSSCDDFHVHSSLCKAKQTTENNTKTVDNIHLIKEHTETLTKQITMVQSEKTSKRLCRDFNYLSTLINQGDFKKFEDISSFFKLWFPTDYDLMCIIGYLHASRDLIGSRFESATRHINSTLEIVPKTSNPRYFTLELYTAKTRKYINEKKLGKLEISLDDAFMILETDPAGCSGRAAGWLYINCARSSATQMTCLNFNKPNALRVYNRLFERTKLCLQKSMMNFKEDGGSDGEYGIGCALCRLVILLLRCGDNGLTMTVLKPHIDDIKTAGQYLKYFEKSDMKVTRILNMHFHLAKCDHEFRLGNFDQALELGQMAFDMATSLDMLELKDHAGNRLTYLQSRCHFNGKVVEINEDNVNESLIDSSDTDALTYLR